MAYLIGTDEAGYGPNLGPLVISASVWRTPDDLRDVDLYELCAPVFSRAALPAGERARVAIADSKILYQPRRGLRGLELGVFAALALLNKRPPGWRQLWDTLAPASRDALVEVPWYHGYDRAVPCDVSPEAVDQLLPALSSRLAQAGVVLEDLRSVAVFPRRFNQLLDQYGSKGELLSKLTLELVRQAIAPLDDEPLLVHCDKHGGRNKYGPLLQQAFPDYLVEVQRESGPLSIYRSGPAARRVEFRFVAKGEGFLPAALASMASKYLRELAMQAFNAFWQSHLPQLKPTAGYPQDARRFKTDIEACQQRLDIKDESLWRAK